MDDTSFVWGHRLKLDADLVALNFFGVALGDAGDAIVFILFLAADIEKDAVAVAELVADGKLHELVESLKGAAGFANEDWIPFGFEGDFDDVIFHHGARGGFDAKTL